MVIIQHSQNRNCSLQHWNARGVPILRANELASIKVRGIFNEMVLVLVCIDSESDSQLLEIVADALDTMRQERIILWSQREPSKELLDHISRLSIKFKFAQILMLAMADNTEGNPTLYRMNPYPTPQFKNVSNIKSPVFLESGYNYYGMTALVRSSADSNIRFYVSTLTGSIPISHVEDFEIIEFARTYNLTLKLCDENDTTARDFDIQFGQRFITRNFPNQMDFINPSTASSLIVIVPCSRQWRFVDVLQRLGAPTLFLCLLAVYVAFVSMESLILWLTHRISGETGRMANLNPLLNPRAFRAILGLSFPEIRRSSTPLRQLVLAISVFGFIFSNFFSCKLSALLTRPALNAQVRNFEELRASGLITLTDEYTHSFIESEIDPEFFHEVIPNYLIIQDSYQRSIGERVYCGPENLTIAWNIPRMYVLGNNSIVKWMLSRPARGTEFPQLKYLSRFVLNIIKEEKTETIVIFKHHLNNNCSLQHWNPHGIAIIRTNDLETFRMKDTFNSRALAIICIEKSSDNNLLDNVAEAFESMRTQRIILWTQMKPTKEFLKKISRKSTDFNFLNLIVLNDNPEEEVSCHRLNPFPHAHFDRIENISKLGGSLFKRVEYNFQGKTATVKHDYNWSPKMGDTHKNLRKLPITRIEDWEVIGFALKHNLTLHFQKETPTNKDRFDIQLKKRIITKNDYSELTDYVNPFCSSSLVVVVPCGTSMSFQDVLKQSGIHKWILYIVIVYVICVLIELFIIKVTLWISGEASHLKILSPLVNLCAFRAILGLSFPEPRRSSISLRQLFMAITIFGMVFSSFINCKLSAMLTKPFHRPQVTNFEELRDSDLVVLVDEYANDFLGTEFNNEFYQHYMPRKRILPLLERVKLVFLCNSRYAVIMFSDNWQSLDNHQRSKGVRAFCSSKDLIIAENLPRMHFQQNNSIYHSPLSRFITTMQESGLYNHWFERIPKILEKKVNQTIIPNISGQKNALSIGQFQWLWYLLIVGYSISIVVFLGEVFLKKWIKP
ncbi:uncharacterized protein LOC108031010 [Drosophila biarmipes]|uniref:uncharacterized protein LOC108031010 n=1 Tax=Drosophila biarmipes TaxID=125945 RepID=UPI0007E6E1D9|nr:uncharacterized protein LOC108031010 [Drosophila biarmipes]